jgi:protein-L-isoaspartate(D-aspartate) O-methyltransferase
MGSLAVLGLVPTTTRAKGAQARWGKLRRLMIEHQLKRRDIRDPGVLKAMTDTPRHLFVPEELRDRAYADRPLPIGEGQTISQPYIVAFMTQNLGLHGGEKVLEIGTGSGYQAAVLAQLAARVFSIEILPGVAAQGRANLAAAGIKNVSLRVGDGYRGWPEEAPFDAVIVTAAADHVPKPLVDQLRPGGRLVIPVGKGDIQQILLVQKAADGKTTTKAILPVRFVPMTGEAEQR